MATTRYWAADDAEQPRAIGLPASCVDALKKHRSRQAEERLRLGSIWEDHGFIFTGHTGQPLHVNTMVYRFNKLVETAGVP